LCCWRSVFKTLVDEIKFGGKLTGRDRSSYYHNC
jgi:hypothetical protein